MINNKILTTYPKSTNYLITRYYSEKRVVDGCLLLVRRKSDLEFKNTLSHFVEYKSAPSGCYIMIKRVALLVFFLIGIIHSDSFGQSSQNTDPLQLKADNDALYELDSTAIIILDFVIHFRVDKSYIDSTYMNNAAVLERINRIVTKQSIAYIDRLIISAYASPEAPLTYNKRLSERRANAVRNYFLKRFSLLKPDIVHAYGHGENWGGLRQMAEKDSLLPMQNEVLHIIDSNLPKDEREEKLKALQGGAVYRYIYKNFYPHLRLGASLNVILAETAPDDLRLLISEPAIRQLAIPVDTLQTSLPSIAIKPIEVIKKEKYNYPLAFRTNLLYDALGGLNIGVEMPLGKKKNWSLIANFAYSYWRSKKNLYALQTLEYGLESRYWFGTNQEHKKRKPNWNQPLKGFYVGAYATYCQRYDVQFIDGYQGDASWSAGLTTGYAIPLSRFFSFDFGIGAGWFSTSQYRHYHQPEYDKHGKYHLMWQQTGSWGGLSLTKLRFALVWMIQTSKPQKRRDNR